MNRRHSCILQAIALLGAAMLLAPYQRPGWTRAADPAPDAYSPVVSTEPLHAAIQDHLRDAREWLLDKDYFSAAQSAQELAALAHLLAHRHSSAASLTKVKDLRAALDSLAAKIKEKDQAGCEKALTKCTLSANALAALPALEEKVVIENYKPFGSTKTWMLLMDAAYVDGKSAKDARAFELLAQALAEEANAAAFLRTDARWRQLSREVRDLALDAARQAKESDLATARLALKKVNERCEACHQGYKR